MKITKTKQDQWNQIKDGVLEVEHRVFDHDLRYQEEHDDFESFVKTNTINFILVDKKRIIGYLMSCPIENDIRYDHDSHFGLNDTLHLESIAILKDCQGKGFGKMLMIRFLSEAKKHRYKRIVLDATSEAMIKLGLQYGFNKIMFYPKWEGNTSSWFMEKIF